jgi:hypothetical protein
MKKDRDSIQVKYERTYTLRHPKFKMFQNVQYLDAAKLSKGSHTLELGKFEGCNCDCAVTAKISNGVIKGFNYPQCEHAKKIPPKLEKKLQPARKKLSKNGPPKWKDIPVRDIGTTNRSGARFGPQAIRHASRMLVDGAHPTAWINVSKLMLLDIGDFRIALGDIPAA